MQIIFNPKTGAPIKGFIYDGVLIEEHPVGKLKQYEENVAEALVENFGFLEKVTVEQAQKMLAQPKEGAFKCEYCDFSTDHKIALAGHTKSHAEQVEAAKLPAIDENLIPVAGGKKVVSLNETRAAEKALLNGQDLPAGLDMDGVEWTGAGLTEENSSLTKAPKLGQSGHFGAA